ncbi:electron transfer flavoprotein subunit beta/FixA family protein [Chloroflexota bacterium]
MNIVVCVKQVLDPEIPADKFRVRANQVVPPEEVAPVINPYDAQAIEAALRLKEKHGAKITAITVGSPDAEDVVRRALSMGVDEGIVLSDDAFTGSDSSATAYILAQAIQKIDAADLILCGREAADWGVGLVGPLIAERLNLPVITLAKNIELLDGNILKVEQVIPDGYQVLEVSPPAVVTVSGEIGLPRLPTGMGIITAARMEIPVWTNQDINADTSLIGANAVHSTLVSLSIPERERKCEIISGETPAELATNLTAKLKELGLI